MCKLSLLLKHSYPQKKKVTQKKYSLQKIQHIFTYCERKEGGKRIKDMRDMLQRQQDTERTQGIEQENERKKTTRIFLSKENIRTIGQNYFR